MKKSAATKRKSTPKKTTSSQTPPPEPVDESNLPSIEIAMDRVKTCGYEVKRCGANQFRVHLPDPIDNYNERSLFTTLELRQLSMLETKKLIRAGVTNAPNKVTPLFVGRWKPVSLEPAPKSERIQDALRKLRARGCKDTFIGDDTYCLTAEGYSGSLKYCFKSENLIRLASIVDASMFEAALLKGRGKYQTTDTEGEDMKATTKTTAATEKAKRDAAASKKSATPKQKVDRTVEREAEVMKLVSTRSKEKPLLRTELNSTLRKVARSLAKKGKITRDETGDYIGYYPKAGGNGTAKAAASTKKPAKKVATKAPAASAQA